MKFKHWFMSGVILAVILSTVKRHYPSTVLECVSDITWAIIGVVLVAIVLGWIGSDSEKDGR